MNGERRRRTGCRYMDLAGLCGNEVVDPDADMLLCTGHLGRVMSGLVADVNRRMREIIADIDARELL